MTADARHLHPVTEAPPPDDDHTPDPTRAAERAVLGAAFTHPSALPALTTTLTGPDFAHPAHEAIWVAIEALYARGRPTDVIAVTEHLTATSQLRRAGGAAHLHSLALAAPPVPENGAYYADIVADHAARRRLAQAAAAIQQLAATPADLSTPDDLKAEALAIVDGVRTRPPGVEDDDTHPWAPQDLATAWDDPTPLEQPTVLARRDDINLLYPAAVHSISGEPESGKTWVALIATTQQLAAGHHVTYIDFEDRAARVTARLKALGADRDAVVERLHYIRPTIALDAAGARHIDAAAQASTLVVIDGVTEAMTMHGLSLLDNEDAAKYLHLLPRRLADLGPAVLQVDHVVKDAEKQGRWAIGAGHKLAGLDGAAYGCKVVDAFGRGRRGRAVITVAKDRPGSVREHASGNSIAELVLDGTAEDGTLYAWLDTPVTSTGPDGSFRPTVLMEKISRHIGAHPGINKREVERAITGKGVHIRKALDLLISEGWVREDRGAHNTSWLHEVTPFRRVDEDPS